MSIPGTTHISGTRTRPTAERRLLLNVSEGPARWSSFFGAVSAAVTLVLAAVVYAVDGVALKQAVDLWASAPAAEKATS